MSKKLRISILDPTSSPELITDVNWKLLLACTFGHIFMAKEALSQGADVNCRRSDYLTPLHIAVQYDNVFCTGLTPLHKAVFLGQKNAIVKLLENGASVNCVDNLSRYPLHYAALQKDVDSATLLLTNGAHVNVYDAFYESPLYTSVIRRPFLPMIKLLLFHGATISSAPNQISLDLLLETILCLRYESDMKILDILFQNGADVNTTDHIGLRTPLHIAAMIGNTKLVIYLIEKGADLERKNSAGHTPIDVAIICRNFKIARLIEKSFSKE
ncbi:serine/threonine-protein phosphatase 6 regulatory ankyrin repeat subunit C-like [Apis florea]|uniref:serine/threonine-protein phosphatase 6 regulatory ankyrin repeat subunit C-like n=1 Tax=Apis florea TaxID=7463 RepID=UPI00062974F6|nr:serine/threonine-protein phosphatase 6 regulatory ankyrin repeat subunit C-like [Apis florea]